MTQDPIGMTAGQGATIERASLSAAGDSSTHDQRRHKCLLQPRGAPYWVLTLMDTETLDAQPPVCLPTQLHAGGPSAVMHNQPWFWFDVGPHSCI
jgi:hypothetical protein